VIKATPARFVERTVFSTCPKIRHNERRDARDSRAAVDGANTEYLPSDTRLIVHGGGS
jgi:hypothetical protein